MHSRLGAAALLGTLVGWVGVGLPGAPGDPPALPADGAPAAAGERSGVGIVVAEHALGFQIRKVVPGSPAHDAQLARGDLVVGVDGVPAAALDLPDFVERVGGPRGSVVRLRVAWRDDAGWREDDVLLARDRVR